MLSVFPKDFTLDASMFGYVTLIVKLSSCLILYFQQLHSHQLFHIFVVAAALAHLQGLHLMADFRLDSSNAVCVADASSNALHSQSFFAQAFNSSTF